MFADKLIKTGGNIMSNFSFMNGTKEYIHKKAESFLKNNGVDISLDDIRTTLSLDEPIISALADHFTDIFEDCKHRAQADCVAQYIEKLMTAVLNEVSKKNETTFSEEYDNFRIHYLHK